MDEIATAAGVVRSTLYVYFASRDRLLRACLGEMYERMQARLAPRRHPEADPAGRLRDLVGALLEQVDGDPAFFRLAVAAGSLRTEPGAAALGAELLFVGAGVAKMLQEIVVEGQGAGAFAERPPERAVALVGQQLYGALAVRATDHAPPRREDTADEICAFLLGALAGSPEPLKVVSPVAADPRSALLGSQGRKDVEAAVDAR